MPNNRAEGNRGRGGWGEPVRKPPGALHPLTWPPHAPFPLALPREVEHWSLTTLREKVVKIGAKVVRHGRYIMFQLAEVAVPRELFERILGLIGGLRLLAHPT